MNTLFNFVGTLKNGQPVKVGDLVKCTYYMYTSFCRVSEVDGLLCIYAPAPFMSVISIDHFQKQYGDVDCVTPSEVYLWCKSHGDDFNYYAQKGLFK
jgi:hypothetical protein